MLSLTPNTTPGDTHGVYRLLDLLVDPNAVKQRLEELTKAKQELDAASAEATMKLAALTKAKSEIAAQVDAANRASVTQANKQQELDAREAQLAADDRNFRARVQQQDAAHEARTQELNKRDDHLQVLRTNYEANGATLKQKLAEVAGLKSQLQAKLSKIKEINDAVL